jgi:hypothetical protein
MQLSRELFDGDRPDNGRRDEETHDGVKQEETCEPADGLAALSKK